MTARRANLVRCAGTSKRSGEQCKRYVLPPATHCKIHGGAAPQVLAKVAEARVSAELQRAVATYGLRRDVLPGDALIEEVQWTAGHVEWLRLQVQALSPDELTWGMTKQTDQQSGQGRKGTDTTFEAGVHALVKLYQAERDHLARVSAAAVRAGVEVQRVKLAEQTATSFIGVFQTVSTDPRLPLDEAGREALRLIVQEHLRRLGGAA